MSTKTLFLCAAMLVAGFLAAEGLHAQAPQPIKRTPLQKFEVPGSNYETVLTMVEIAPGASFGRHIHPGVELGYLMEGELTILVEGLSERTYKTGETWRVEEGKVHDARAGDTPTRVVAAFVVEKGKPLASPAP
jgi:quercetin dioxygenase-like cupin family protein